MQPFDWLTPIPERANSPAEHLSFWIGKWATDNVSQPSNRASQHHLRGSIRNAVYSWPVEGSGLRGWWLFPFWNFGGFGCDGLLVRLCLCSLWLLCGLCLFPGSNDGVQSRAFHPGMELHNAALADILDQAIDDLISELAMGHLTATKTQGRLDLVAFLQETDSLVLFRLVVMLVNSDGEIDFLNDDDLLFLARRSFALILFIQELAVILDTANRRHGIGGNLHQVKAALTRDF
jgi:hypothetical protein